MDKSALKNYRSWYYFWVIDRTNRHKQTIKQIEHLKGTLKHFDKFKILWAIPLNNKI
jgi:hypothetical protein